MTGRMSNARGRRASRASVARKPGSKAKKSADGAMQSFNKLTANGDWRQTTLNRMRKLILEADPAIIEEQKWKKPSNPQGVVVWSQGGIICTGETYKNVVKLTFARGASLPDPAGLFNSSLAGNTRRAIDIHEGEKIDAGAFRTLVKAAVTQNSTSGANISAKKAASRASKAKSPKLLSGGNPQIAKGDGDGPVQAYIAAMPGWKRGVGKQLDSLIVRSLPGVRKAVKWNSPFYGIDGQGFFLSFHVFARYVKVAFFRGSSLRPLPPGESKQKDVRYLDIYEDDELDELQLADWVRQAATLPGWVP